VFHAHLQIPKVQGAPGPFHKQLDRRVHELQVLSVQAIGGVRGRVEVRRAAKCGLAPSSPSRDGSNKFSGEAWGHGRVEILNSRKPSDIVKRSNAQVKKMVTNAEEVEAWFAEWGGPAPLWKMFHDDGTHSFAPVDGTGQQACDHFLDICERKMGLSTCLKLEHFTMGASN